MAKLSMALMALASVTACQPSASANASLSTATPKGSDQVGAGPTTSPVLAETSPTPPDTTDAPASVPPVWNFITDDFESGSLARWGEASPADLGLTPGAGHDGSTGLSVTVGKGFAYLYKSGIVKTQEGYATFWFNPNNVEIPDQPDVPIPGKSIRIVDVKGYQHYDVIVGLRIWQPVNSGAGYRGYLEWQAADGDHFDTASGQFTLANGWQQITVGFRTNEWVAVWINGALVRQVNGIQHSEAFGQSVDFGKANDDSVTIPSGSMQYDDLAFQIPRIPDLWVDSVSGDDGNTGLQRTAAFRTIQKAAAVAGPGTTVHILSGIYRESIHPAADGTAAAPTTYKAEEGPGTVIIRGSVASNMLSWHPMQSNTIGLPAGVDPSQIYVADLSAWKLGETPRFLVQIDDHGEAIARLPLAREPDWPVQTPWKYAEFWWSADGGSAPAACDPSTDSNPNCDAASRSLTMLTDRTNDVKQPGVEPGNLTTLGDLTGGTLVALDTVEGHYVYRRTIVADDVAAGQITVDLNCEFDSDSRQPALGWGTRYYVEGRPSLLDTPGEWWYDASSGLLYLWPPSPTTPAKLDIEISVGNNGFDLSGRSNIILDGLTLEFFNGTAIQGENDPNEKSANNTVRNVVLRYADDGIVLNQNVGDNPANITSQFALEHSDIGHMDTHGISLAYTWKDDSAPASFNLAGITDTRILDNQLHDLGFRSDDDNANGLSFEHADKLRFEGNHVYDIAHNGVQFSWSVIQSDKPYGFAPAEIKTGGILVKDNVFERACELTPDCGGLKFWGDPPLQLVYRDVLITGNIFRDTVGWASIAEERHRWEGGPQSSVQGMGGFGLYVDMASGITVYRNIAYNNSFAGFMLYGRWRDGNMLYYNNVAANSLYGFFVQNSNPSISANGDLELGNNMILNNEANGLSFFDPAGQPEKTTIDYNLYYNNGWRAYTNGGVLQPGAVIVGGGTANPTFYPTLKDIQSNTGWEAHGQAGDPSLANYPWDDHSLAIGASPDFHLTARSANAIDAGTPSLPEALLATLAGFAIPEQPVGNALDIGFYEYAGP